MAETARIHRISPLELTMRDVLGNAEDFATEFAWQSRPGTFEILSIEEPAPIAPRQSAQVVPLRRRAVQQQKKARTGRAL